MFGYHNIAKVQTEPTQRSLLEQSLDKLFSKIALAAHQKNVQTCQHKQKYFLDTLMCDKRVFICQKQWPQLVSTCPSSKIKDCILTLSSSPVPFSLLTPPRQHWLPIQILLNGIQCQQNEIAASSPFFEIQ